jgi:hypothetical protein
MSQTLLTGDVRAPGTPNPSGDVNNLNDVLLGLGAKNNVQNTAWAGGADPTGTADSTAAINAALAAVPAGGGAVYVPAGTYLVNTATALAMTAAGTVLRGDGPMATIIRVGSSFTGAQVLGITADSCEVRDIGFAGASSTVTSNPARNAVELGPGVQHCRLSNLWFQYVNAWCIESVGGASRANLDTMIDRVVCRNCAAGIHVQGVSGSGFSAEHFLSGIQMQQMGASTGTSANLPALELQDCQDTLVLNLNIGVAAGTGSAITIIGAVSTALFGNVDVAGGTNTVTIADSGGNSPGSVFFSCGTIQQSTLGPGLSVTGGAQDIECDHVYFHRCSAAGIQVSNTGLAPCMLTDCRWNANNQAAGATQYDADFSTATTAWMVRGGLFSSAVGTLTAGKVSAPVNDPGQVATFLGTNFNGTGTLTSNVGTGPLVLYDCIVTGTLAVGPMTALGDTLYGGPGGGNTTRLAGNVTTTKKFYTQTGTGSASAGPLWGGLASGDIPANAANTSGTAANITDTLDQVPTAAASVSLGSHKITSLANGSAASDAAAFGQIPLADSASADIQPAGTAAAAGSSGKWPNSDHVHKQNLGGLFGSGSDGAITFDGTTTPVAGATLSGSTYTLTRDIQATSITINGSVTVKPANFRFFAQGTFTNNGTISYTGANASGSSAGAGIGGSASLVSNPNGGAGGTGVSGAGASGTARNFGPASGAGGAGTSGGAGAAATPANTAAALTANVLSTPVPLLTNQVNYANTGVALSFGAGGSGGGSDASSNAGGGGGAGGGIVVIFAWALGNGSGTITVAGGNGGNAAGGNAGGGGGGTGGLIVAVTLAAWTAGTMTVSGGALGSKSGTGSNGSAGNSGSAVNLVVA